MKFKKLLGLGMVLLCLAACKKENPLIEPPVEKPNPLESLSDSASYVIDGKLISVNKVNSFGGFNFQPNSKVDSIVNYAQYISGDKDSIMFGQKYDIHDLDYVNDISIVFAKKFNKNNMNSNNSLWSNTPKNYLEMFYTGNYPYAVDLYKENSQNGIAIFVRNENRYFKTSGPDSFGQPTSIKKDAQKDSKFEVTKLVKLKSGGYFLEAKFAATIFDGNEKPRKIENGYLRLKLNIH
jgi:predicted small lipoprotein YifL